MKFNPTKCYVMTISLATKYRITHNYVLHDTPLPAVNQLKYLGITLQNNLKWVAIRSCFQSKGFLRRNFKMAPQKIRELAYCTMIRPQVEYAVSAWSAWLLQDIYRLERLQRRSTRFVSRNYQQTASVSNMLNKNSLAIKKCEANQKPQWL